jgi:hypothetical protein
MPFYQHRARCIFNSSQYLGNRFSENAENENISYFICCLWYFIKSIKEPFRLVAMVPSRTTVDEKSNHLRIIIPRTAPRVTSRVAIAVTLDDQL